MALLPPPDISAAYVDTKTGDPTKEFFNWLKSLYDYTRGITTGGGGGGGAPPGGSTGQVQYNAGGGVFGGYTPTQVTAIILPFTNTLTGAVPAPGGAPTGKVLSDSGAWITPSGGGSGAPGGASLTLQYNNAGSFDGIANSSWNSATATITLGLGTKIKSNSTYFASPNYLAGNSQSIFEGRIGTAASPNSVADAPFIFQKYSTGTNSGVNPAVYAAITKTDPGSNMRSVAIFAEAEDKSGWNGSGLENFIEGIRAQATLTGGSLGSAYGLVTAAGDATGISYTYLVGAELGTVNNSGVDALGYNFFNKDKFAAGAVASNSGPNKSDVGFLVNPYNVSVYKAGFMVGENSVEGAAFVNRANVAVGLDLSFPSYSTMAIKTPHTTIDDSGGNTVLQVAGALGTGAVNGFTYLPSCAGTPTGVPTSYAGAVPIVIDTSGSFLWAYVGGAWKKAALT